MTLAPGTLENNGWQVVGMADQLALNATGR